MDKVLFYLHRGYVFDSFAAFKVNIWNVDWMTAEHAYQAKKFIFGSQVWREIKDARSAHEAKQIARANNALKKGYWDDIKVLVMEEVNRAKLNQHRYIQEELLATDDAELIEDSPEDSFWGRGPDGNGENHTGKIWMKLREELKQPNIGRANRQLERLIGTQAYKKL